MGAFQPDEGTQSRFSLLCAAGPTSTTTTTGSSGGKVYTLAEGTSLEFGIRSGADASTTTARGLKNGRDEEEKDDDDRASEDTEARVANRYLYAHGSLVILGWGVLLPSGAICARLAKHRSGGFWFQLHRALQVSGLVVVFTAWVIAINFFDDVEVNEDNDNDDTQKSVEFIVVVLGMSQEINVLLQPRVPHGGEVKTHFRFLWEIVHKTSGHLAVVFAVLTIYLGTTLIPITASRDKFQRAYFCAGWRCSCGLRRGTLG